MDDSVTLPAPLARRILKALHPLASRAFNDNFDLTVDMHSFTYNEIVSGYFAHRELQRLVCPKPSQESPIIVEMAAADDEYAAGFAHGYRSGHYDGRRAKPETEKQ